MNLYQTTVQEYDVREEVLGNKTYLVVPVTMMVEGVHNGSAGPLLHTAAELGKIPESWNGIPVTIGHPRNDDGFIPANDPQVLEEWAIGSVFHTVMEGQKLKSEAWLEKDKLQTVNENLFDRINNGEIVEVSVGVFSEDEETEGSYQGEDYVAVATNLRPEHLAILPHTEGACSVDDGCGIRVNNKNMLVNEENRTQVLEELRQTGYNVAKIVVHENSLTEKVDIIRSAVYAMDNENTYFYIEEVFESYVIYRKEDRVNNTSNLYKHTFVFTADETVEFVGEPVQVTRNVEYVTVQANTRITRKRKVSVNSKKEVTMSDGKCPECIRKVNALITNEKTAYTEDDREWLETLEETQLDKMQPTVVEKEVSVQAEVTPEMAVNALKEGLKSPDDFIKLMPEEMQEQTRNALTLHEQRRTDLVDGILKNTEEGIWQKEELEKMKVNQLEKIAKSSGFEERPTNYAGMGAGGGTQVQANESDEDLLMAPPGITFDKKD